MKMAWVGMLDQTTNQIVPVAFDGSGTEYLKDLRLTIDADQAAGRGPSGTAFRENRPVWCQDFLHDPATAPWHERGEQFGWAASAALPLHRNGATIGLFTLYASEVNAFDEPARNLLQEMVMDIDYALNSFEREAQRQQAEERI